MKLSESFAHTLKTEIGEGESTNYRLLVKAGFINQTAAGVYTYLPLGLRVLNKIAHIVRREMNALGGQELLMPVLQPKKNWETTNRWDTFDVLYKVKDTLGHEMALGPTHEEIVTPLAKDYIFSYRELPRAVYQVQTKFRSEARPKSGVLRGREFLMKDMYSFHATENDLETYYKEVGLAYVKAFQNMGFPFGAVAVGGPKDGIVARAEASGGDFSKYSHEFQVLTPVGEDTIYMCKEDHAFNKEVVDDFAIAGNCPTCAENKQVNPLKPYAGIEIANIFMLNTRFSSAFGLNYTDEKGKLNPVWMGCYGIGISRLMGAIVETHNDDKGIKWPKTVAPALAQLVSIGDSEEVRKAADQLYGELIASEAEIIYDDRDESAGTKFADADLMGMPWRLVVSPKTIKAGSVELKARDKDEGQLVPIDKIVKVLLKEPQ